MVITSATLRNCINFELNNINTMSQLRYAFKQNTTKIGLVFTTSLFFVSTGYMLYLQNVKGVNIQADGQKEVDNFSLIELFPKESPFGNNWPFTPTDQLPPHPKFGVRNTEKLQSTTMNRIQNGEVSFKSLFFPPDADENKNEKSK